jgi:hypothetical protein
METHVKGAGLAAVISILSLMMMPFGTIVGVYGLWVLFSKQTEQLFAVSG